MIIYKENRYIDSGFWKLEVEFASARKKGELFDADMNDFVSVVWQMNEKFGEPYGPRVSVRPARKRSLNFACRIIKELRWDITPNDLVEKFKAVRVVYTGQPATWKKEY